MLIFSSTIILLLLVLAILVFAGASSIGVMPYIRVWRAERRKRIDDAKERSLEREKILDEFMEEFIKESREKKAREHRKSNKDLM